MKKLFFAFTALAAMTSCSNDELVDVTPKQAIIFGDAFVDNATRAIDQTLTSSTLNTFNVYGTVSGDEGEEQNVQIFKDVLVTNGGTIPTDAVTGTNNWWYNGANTQYWIEGNNYKFAAIANGDVTEYTDNMPSKISYSYEDDVAATKDLLYATVTKDNYTASEGSDVVNFTFNHLLAKVQFTFKNTITTNTAAVNGKGDGVMYTYKVSDVKITNAYKAGEYTIGSSLWSVTTTGASPRIAITFGDISNANAISDADTAIEVGAIGIEAFATSNIQKLLIPNTYTDLTVTCKIETCLNGSVIDTEDEYTINVPSVTLKAGHAYNFIISKGAPGKEIKFSVEKVETWNPETDTLIEN